MLLIAIIYILEFNLILNLCRDVDDRRCSNWHILNYVDVEYFVIALISFGIAMASSDYLTLQVGRVFFVITFTNNLSMNLIRITRVNLLHLIDFFLLNFFGTWLFVITQYIISNWDLDDLLFFVIKWVFFFLDDLVIVDYVDVVNHITQIKTGVREDLVPRLILQHLISFNGLIFSHVELWCSSSDSIVVERDLLF